MRIVLLAAILGLNGISNEAVYRVPLVNEHGVLFVHAAVNDTAPLLFVFDPGAGDFITAYANARIRGKRVDEVRIGSLAIREQLPVFPGDGERLVPRHDIRFGSIAGSLGPAILERYVVRLDYAKNTMTLMPFSTFRAAADAVAIKFAFDSYRIPVIAAVVDGIRGRFEVDVRAPAGMLFTPFVQRGDFTRRYSAQTPARTSFDRREYRVSRVAIGPFRLRDRLMWFSAAAKGKFATREVDGLLGNDALSKFTVTLNYRASTLYLESSEANTGRVRVPGQLNVTFADVRSGRRIK